MTDLTRGVASVRDKAIELPPEAEAIRDEVQAVRRAASRTCPPRSSAPQLIETGYVMPHWPKPYGRAAGAVEQLVIEQEFAAAGARSARPTGSPAWVILTLIQYATEDQVARWVRPALEQEVIWCQLFSEPDAGSDAAGVKTKATRVDGGWLVNGQKVWTSGAHVAGHGLRHRAHQPRRAQARRHHHDGRSTCTPTASRCGPLKMTIGSVGVQRGLLQRRVRARRRRGRPGRRRLDRGPGHARQRERQHRRRRSGGMSMPGDGADRRRSTPTPSGSPGARPASVATSPSTRRWDCSTCAAPIAPSPAVSPDPRER